jgi:outer membrane protein TolC
MLKLAKIRYPYNQGTLGDIYKVEGRLGELQNMISMALGDIEESSYRLKALMNLSPDTMLSVDTTVVTRFRSGVNVQDTMLLNTSRSDIRRIDRSIDVMLANQRLQRLQSKPDFKIRFDHMQPIANMPAQFTAMAMVSIPIAPWSSKMYRSEVKGMEFDITAMREERAALLLEARGMVAAMTSKIVRMNQQLENYRIKIIPALTRNYQSVMVSYEENREQLPMVIDGWEALNMARMEYLNKLENYYTMIVDYEKELEK